MGPWIGLAAPLIAAVVLVGLVVRRYREQTARACRDADMLAQWVWNVLVARTLVETVAALATLRHNILWHDHRYPALAQDLRDAAAIYRANMLAITGQRPICSIPCSACGEQIQWPDAVRVDVATRGLVHHDCNDKGPR